MILTTDPVQISSFSVLKSALSIVGCKLFLSLENQPVTHKKSSTYPIPLKNTLLGVLSRYHRSWSRHCAFVRPLGSKTSAQCLDRRSSASIWLRKSFLSAVKLLHKRLAGHVCVSQVSQTSYVSNFLEADLRFQEQCVESVQEELPGENPAVAKAVVDLVQRLEHHRPVDDHRIKLSLQTHDQRLKLDYVSWCSGGF